jgi:hypothetical protein
MKQEDKLRTALRGHYDNQEELFNDRDWERASAYLEAEKRKRKIRYPILILAALLAGSFMTLINVPKLGAASKKELLAEQKPVPAPTLTRPALHTPLLAEQNPVRSKPKQAYKPSSPTVMSAPAARVSRTKTDPAPFGDKTLQVTVTPAISAEPDLSEPENAAKEINISDPRPGAIAAIKSNLQKNVKPEVANYHEDHEGSSPVKMESQAPDQKQAPGGEPTAEDRTAGLKNPAVDAPSSAPSVIIDDIAQAETAEVSKNSNENNGPGPDKKEDQAPDQNQAPGEGTPAAPVDLTPRSATMALNNDKKQVTADPLSFIAPGTAFVITADTFRHVSATATDEEIEEWDTLSRSSLLNFAGEGIFYEAGAAWLYGWKGAQKRDARGVSPVAGINYMNRLNRRCALSFGLQYLRVGNLSNSSKTSRVSSYVYGEQNRVTVITPSTIHYLQVPLRFHYYFNRRNSMGAGINLAYLLNVEAKVTRYDERAGLRENYETMTLAGYTNGFSWFDSQATLFYNRKIGNSLALQAAIFLGLTDVKQDVFFNLSQKERNSGAKLSLIYYAFRKNGKR